MTTTRDEELRQRFGELHRAPRGFVMPNAWDPGTAIMLAKAGFEAIATTSGGIAFSLGRPDYAVPDGASRVTREAMFERMAAIAAAVEIPVNGDLEDGYGETPDAVAETIQMAIDAGLAGGNIEDNAGAELFELELAVERIVAARETIDAAGSAFVLTARTDGQVGPRTSLAETIERAIRFREAGADCVYAPGITDLDEMARFVREVGAPVNAVVGLGDTTLTTGGLLDRGVARISTGATMARRALAYVREAAAELREHGTLGFAEGQIPQFELSELFIAHERETSAAR